MTRSLLGTPIEVIASASSGEQARVAKLLASILPVTPRRLGLLNDGDVTTHLTRYELERIAAPTLAVSVADDLYGTYDVARYTAEQIPGARFVGYPSGGHVFVGRQDAVTTELSDFLRESPPTADSR
jgi:pimeloyl-ACP methyl ester carboxylesterase